MFKKIKSKIKSFINLVVAFFATLTASMTTRAKKAVAGTAAEAYVDTGVKILIAVVVGALLLTLLYGLFNDVVAPNVEEKVVEMFTYTG